MCNVRGVALSSNTTEHDHLHDLILQFLSARQSVLTSICSVLRFYSRKLYCFISVLN